ncbi:hypothetical protein D0Y65_053907, partial [Glycine soja]
HALQQHLNFIEVHDRLKSDTFGREELNHGKNEALLVCSMLLLFCYPLCPNNSVRANPPIYADPYERWANRPLTAPAYAPPSPEAASHGRP